MESPSLNTYGASNNENVGSYFASSDGPQATISQVLAPMDTEEVTSLSLPNCSPE